MAVKDIGYSSRRIKNPVTYMHGMSLTTASDTICKNSTCRIDYISDSKSNSLRDNQKWKKIKITLHVRFTTRL